MTLSGSSTAVTSIDLKGLTAGISAADFSNATQTSGVIIISSTSNYELFKIILANLQKEGEAEVELHH